MAIECAHPRPALNMPSGSPGRLRWQPPSFIPENPADMRRFLAEQLRAIHSELMAAQMSRAVVPLIDSLIQAQSGQIIQGVADGQTIVLPPTVPGQLDDVRVIIDDVINPVTVVHPDGTTTEITTPGTHDFNGANGGEYGTPPATAALGAGTFVVEVADPVNLPSAYVATDSTELDWTFSTGLVTLAVRNGSLVLTRLATQATDTFVANVTAGTASPTAVAATSFAGVGLAWNATTHAFDVTGSTSITITSDQVQRAALTGAIVASANSNATLFGGIRDNGSAENDRTNLNFLSSTSCVFVVTDDSANDELEITVQRAALTGLIDAAQNSNATTSAEPFVTYSASSNMSAERVMTSTTSVTVDIGTAAQIRLNIADRDYGDITVSTTGTVWTIDNSAVTNAKLANMAAGTVKGRQIDAGTGAPVDLTGLEQGENLRLDTRVDNNTATGAQNSFAVATETTWVRFTSGISGPVLNGCANVESGKLIFWSVDPAAGDNVLVTDESASATAAQRFRTPSGLTVTLSPGDSMVTCYTGSRHRVLSVAGYASSINWAGVHNFNETIFGVTHAGPLNANALLSVNNRLRLNAVCNPTALSSGGSTNNYNPTDWSTCNVILLSVSGGGSHTITGFDAAGGNGALKLLVCEDGSITLPNESASSTAANRMKIAHTTTLSTDEAALAWYDAAQSRWRLVTITAT